MAPGNLWLTQGVIGFDPFGALNFGRPEIWPGKANRSKCVFPRPVQWGRAINIRHSAARDIPTAVYFGGMYSQIGLAK